MYLKLLPLTIPISEQVWPEGTIPVVTIRTNAFMHETFIRDCIEGILMKKTSFPFYIFKYNEYHYIFRNKAFLNQHSKPGLHIYK